jgi:hypothetical protein
MQGENMEDENEENLNNGNSLPHWPQVSQK